MKMDIRDSGALRSLRPLEVAAYLRSHGWTATPTTKNASTWTNFIDNEEYEVTVPLDNSVGDYALRLSEVLQSLAAAEQRSQSQVYSDLLTTFADVIRIRIDDPELSDGTLPIEAHAQIAQIAQKAKDLVLAAACSATERRSVWHSRKPAQATEYIRNLRTGQTERGSYILTIISRVPPALHIPQNGELFESEAPYERRVVQTLASSLTFLDVAAANAALSGEFEAFEGAAAIGISANLCDAVAGMWGTDNSQRNLEFNFSWSPARPIESGTPSRVKFSADRIPLIREAGRLMRERDPITDFEIDGAVIKLDRKTDEATGRVTIFGQIEGKPKTVVLELDSQSYDQAITAHRTGRPLRCIGTLVRDGRSYALRNAKSFILDED